jgi:hypothetical protein
MRSTYFLGLFLISSFGCSSLGNQDNNQSTSSSSTVLVNETLKAKPLPILGSLETQLKFEIDDSLAVIAEKPRPTYPETLAVLAGNPPQGTDVCNLSYAALIKAMYASCFPEGITYIAMSNVIGWAGEENSRSGDTVIYTWGGGERGTLTATFTNGRLTAKSQLGLK